MSSDPHAQVTEHINNHARAANDLAEWLAEMAKAWKAGTDNAELKWRGPAAEQAIEFTKTIASITEDLAIDAGRLSWTMYVQQAADAEKNQNP